MKVLVLGGGGREHALCWKLAQSPCLMALYAAPGNPGIAAHATCIAIDPADRHAVLAFCREAQIDLVVVGPEQPLVAGVADALAAAGIACFGPSRAAARLEGSKGFTKELCARAGIPTARFVRCDSLQAARVAIATFGAPVVIKADGLAAGKGVVIAQSIAEAEAAAAEMLDGRFGAAGAELVIEEFLTGEEISVFVVTDGETAVPLMAARDHKRVGDGDTGPNTGGMGAFAPTRLLTPDLEARILEEIITPTVRTLAAEGTPYCGVLYAGLMLTADGPRLIEYNCRFGDPECQVLMVMLESDLLPLVSAAATGTLHEQSVQWRDGAALTVVLAARGYPETPVKGGIIAGLEPEDPDVTVFHAGTALRDGVLTANGGRVLNVTARGATLAEARTRAYATIDRIRWADGFCRRDIGAKEA